MNCNGASAVIRLHDCSILKGIYNTFHELGIWFALGFVFIMINLTYILQTYFTAAGEIISLPQCH